MRVTIFVMADTYWHVGYIEHKYVIFSTCLGRNQWVIGPGWKMSTRMNNLVRLDEYRGLYIENKINTVYHLLYRNYHLSQGGRARILSSNFEPR